MAGDCGQIAPYSEAAAEQCITRRAITPGMRVLDVACGIGNAAIPTAKAGAIMRGVDIIPNLLEPASIRAQREGVRVQFDESNVAQLPYPDVSSDLIVSKCGAMFAPRPERGATELVCAC